MSSRPIDDDAGDAKPAEQARLASSPDHGRLVVTTSAPDVSGGPVEIHSGFDLLAEEAMVGDIEFAAPKHHDIATPATFD